MDKRSRTKPKVALTKTHYDLIIIGGGINGTGIARDASLRGLSVAILEQHTWGSGTSSKSSKLAHGGLRYLEQLEFSLIKESLHERDILLKTASDYVEPLEFILPVYKTSKRPLWQINIGMWAYNYLAGNSTLSQYKMLTKPETISICPQLKQRHLTGGARYFDARMKDYELVLATLKDALNNGAEGLEYAKVTGFKKEKEKITGIDYIAENKTHTLYAPAIINTTGAWSNMLQHLDNPTSAPLVAPTKGVHLYVKELGLTHALTLEAPQDKRVFFMIPENNRTLIGTTDTPFTGNPNDIVIEESDINYLLTASNHYLVTNKLTQNDILDSYAGLRPLQYSKKSASKRSRDFTLNRNKSGLYHMYGGKYTTYRHMAEVALNRIIADHSFSQQLKPCETKTRQLPKL